MSSRQADEQRQRIEDEAYEWVSKIIADRKCHAEGLRDWVGTSEERADIYNEAYRHQTEGGAIGGQVFGNVRQRQANRFMPQVRTIPYFRIIAITAALTLFGAGLSFAISALTRHVTHEHATGPATDYATRIGEVRTVALPDGSVALLDTQTEIRISFSKAERHIDMIRGRARFTVAHNSAWPFIVKAGHVSVTARGTVFDIDMARGIAVHLLRGAVDVAYDDPKSLKIAAPTHLKAGERIVVDPASPQGPGAPGPAPSSDAQWAVGFKSFDDVPAGTIIEETNLYSQTRIHLADAADKDRLVFLDLHIRDTRKVAQDLANFLNLDMDETQPGEIVLRHRK
jgi:transmembrane sensor